MVNKLEKGCTFGLVLEQKVISMEKSINDGFNNMKNELKTINNKQTELFNHQSTRIPPETVAQMKTQWKIITILTGILCTLLGVAGTFIIAMVKYGGV